MLVITRGYRPFSSEWTTVSEHWTRAELELHPISYRSRSTAESPRSRTALELACLNPALQNQNAHGSWRVRCGAEKTPNSHFWRGKTWEKHDIFFWNWRYSIFSHTHIWSSPHFSRFQWLTGSLGPGLKFCGLIVILRGILRLQARDEAHHFLWPKLGILPNITSLLGFLGTNNI